jgi:hypothetical protein
MVPLIQDIGRTVGPIKSCRSGGRFRWEPVRGNGTLIGASANVVSAAFLPRVGTGFRSRNFTKYGAE